MLNTGKLAGKTVFITGASRGIGKSIGLKFAKDGAKIVIAAKSAEPHKTLPGTIYTAAEEIEKAGGKALPCVVDVRSEEAVQTAVEQAVKEFGGIDILVNNASAIHLSKTSETPMKRYDLMNQINARGTFLCSKMCLPYLRQSKNAHIVNIAPPLNMKPVWFKQHVAYTIAKYGMSMCTLGMSAELQGKVGVNSLWPKTAIATAAMEMLGGGESIWKSCRSPDIMADAAYCVVNRDAKNYTGQFLVDEEVLQENGVKDFSSYLMPGASEESLMPDYFLDAAEKYALANEAKAEDVAANTQARHDGPVFHIFKKLDRIIEKQGSDTFGIKAIYVFQLGKDGTWHLDLKNGKAGPLAAPIEADVTFSLGADDFVNMFAGKLSPTSAFMGGQMKISGDMALAMKLQKVMGTVQGK